jgi:hypothetical protein
LKGEAKAGWNRSPLKRSVRRLQGISQLSESEIQKAIENHLARNRELKKLIISKGVDLEEKRTIDLHFWASGEVAARNLGVALETAGYSVGVSKPSESDSSLWSVEGKVNSSPLAVTTPFFVERLVRLAAENQAEFDGWGTSI